jgi:hypothetical protein
VKGDESPIAYLKRMMIRKCKQLEGEFLCENNSMNIKGTWIKNWR